MSAITTPVTTDRLASLVTTSPSTNSDGTSKQVAVLPFALREDEITVGDFDVLFQIAENPDGPGHLRRPTRSIPSVK